VFGLVLGFDLFPKLVALSHELCDVLLARLTLARSTVNIVRILAFSQSVPLVKREQRFSRAHPDRAALQKLSIRWDWLVSGFRWCLRDHHAQQNQKNDDYHNLIVVH
jgi:hypothetical protein